MKKNIILVAFTVALMAGINTSAYEVTSIDNRITANGSDW